MFGMMEAQRQRRSGLGFDRYFSLSKYVRQSFVDLIHDISPSTQAERQALTMTHRFFDKVELGFTTEWLHSLETASVSDTTFTSPAKEDSMHATVELKRLVSEVLGCLQPIKPSTIIVESRFETDDDQIIADPSQIRQMLENLCTNSITAMQKQGGILLVVLDQIMIESHPTYIRYGLRGGLYAKLNIRDTGRGIAPEILDRIFEPFFTTKDVDEGNGMGLALVQSIVQEHGGFINVDSAPDKWTNITILLPRNRWGSDGGETAEQRKGARGSVPRS
jgi:signal transduction histidine kinase